MHQLGDTDPRFAVDSKSKDRCWMSCSDLISEVQVLRTELLKLQQDVVALDLQ